MRCLGLSLLGALVGLLATGMVAALIGWGPVAERHP
jgi:hypothetical protein